MPRSSRVDCTGALHHVIIRGMDRQKIFLDDIDRDRFLDRFGAVLLETGICCYAWALIPNHAHFLLRTGNVPIATLMRRLLTGYATTFNHRHRRHGKLFQNRYKSILCQEESYFLELVRYIHLNPLRARIVKDYVSLARHKYAGHSVVLGKCCNEWQEVGEVLIRFGRVKKEARAEYREYVRGGIELGRRPELVGGGLIRSIGGWEQVKYLKKRDRIRSDERILGDSNFVGKVLLTSNEELERRYRLRAEGYDFERIVDRVAQVCGISKRRVVARGRYRDTVRARDILCYWAVREGGMTATEVARKLVLTQPAVSIAVRRGEERTRKEGLELLEE